MPMLDVAGGGLAPRNSLAYVITGYVIPHERDIIVKYIFKYFIIASYVGKTMYELNTTGNI